MRKVTSLMVAMILIIMVVVPYANAAGEREVFLVESYNKLVKEKNNLQVKIVDIDKRLLRIEGAVAEVRHDFI